MAMNLLLESWKRALLKAACDTQQKSLPVVTKTAGSAAMKPCTTRYTGLLHQTYDDTGVLVSR